jgi:hypothetical protein
VAHARLDVFCILSRADLVIQPMHVKIMTAGNAGRHSTLLYVPRVAYRCLILRLPVMLALILAILS